MKNMDVLNVVKKKKTGEVPIGGVRRGLLRDGDDRDEQHDRFGEHIGIGFLCGRRPERHDGIGYGSRTESAEAGD